jgi:hypothetical protein
MPQHRDAFRAYGREHARGLIVRAPQQRMGRGHHELEPPALLRLQIEAAVGEDVRFDALEDPESSRSVSISRCCAATDSMLIPRAIGRP